MLTYKYVLSIATKGRFVQRMQNIEKRSKNVGRRTRQKPLGEEDYKTRTNSKYGRNHLPNRNCMFCKECRENNVYVNCRGRIKS